MLDRRIFLKLTGLLAAASALDTLPVFAQSDTATDAGLLPAGTYQFSGQVRLHEPVVEISGITNAHQISQSAGSMAVSVASFTSFEQFDRPWRMPAIQVRGGELEAVRVTALDFG